MKKQYIETGEIAAVHGVRGEVRVNPWSDSADFVCEFKRFYTDEKASAVMEVESSRPHKNIVIVKFKGCDDVETAQKLRGTVLFINRDDCKLLPGEFFVQDLFGMEVRDVDTDECYGSICEVSQTGANDVYHIAQEGKREKLIPAIPQVIISTDIDKNIMLIRPLEGLFDAN
ncbi:MAG: ribosome maturation factor RimM [Hydrogenoanaerobacterium sp.]